MYTFMIFNMCSKDNGFSAHRSQLADVSMHSMDSPFIKLGLGLSFFYILLLRVTKFSTHGTAVPMAVRPYVYLSREVNTNGHIFSEVIIRKKYKSQNSGLSNIILYFLRPFLESAWNFFPSMSI